MTLLLSLLKREIKRVSDPVVLDIPVIKHFSQISQTTFDFRIIKISFNDCQPKTIGFRVSTSNLGHLHG